MKSLSGSTPFSSAADPALPPACGYSGQRPGAGYLVKHAACISVQSVNELHNLYWYF